MSLDTEMRSAGAAPRTPAARSLLGERTTRDWTTLLSRPSKQAKLSDPSHDNQRHQLFHQSVRDRRASILERTISAQRYKTMEQAEARQRRQLDQSWEREKEQLMHGGERRLITNGPEEKKEDTGGSLLAIGMGPAADINTGSLLVQGVLGNVHSGATPNMSADDLRKRIEHFAKAVKDSFSGDAPPSDPADLLLHNLHTVSSSFCTSPNAIAFETGFHSALTLLRFIKSSPSPSIGVLLFLCHESKSIITRRVAQAKAAGQIPFENEDEGFASEVASFVRLKFGSHGHTIYHILYFCLRCGDAYAAKSALDFAAANGETVDASIREAVTTLSERQGSAPCLWKVQRDGDTSPLLLPNTVLQSIERLLHQQHNQNGNVDIYFKAALSILSSGHIDLPTSDDEGLNTIEDYMFGQFIFSETNEGASKVGAMIRQCGPAHFQHKTWSYVLPLLISQQYASALSHLARAGGTLGLMQATHLGMVLGEVSDCGSPSPSGLVSDLLVAYATEISLRDNHTETSTLMSLEYLLRVPDAARMEKEMASLVDASYGFSWLYGVLSENGVREGALLDQKLDRVLVNRILSRAAQLRAPGGGRYQREMAEAAGNFFLLSGSYGRFLAFLNGLLAYPERPEHDKAYWAEQSKMFYSTYLQRQTRVLESLEREGQLGFVDTNVVLVNLHDFFGLVRQSRYTEAQNLIIGQNLLPLTEDDLNAKVSIFPQLDPIIRNAMPSVILASMECLFHLREYRPGVVLYTFSGLVLQDVDVLSRIGELRSRMV